MAEIDSLDVELLYAVAEAKKPASSWELARKYAEKPTVRSSLDTVFRYRLKRLTEKGLLEETTIQKGGKTVTRFQLPQKTVCHKGSFFIFTNPITILACPHYPKKCPSQCKPILFEKNKKIIVKGCPLIQNAPENLKELIYQHFTSNPLP